MDSEGDENRAERCNVNASKYSENTVESFSIHTSTGVHIDVCCIPLIIEDIEHHI